MHRILTSSIAIIVPTAALMGMLGCDPVPTTEPDPEPVMPCADAFAEGEEPLAINLWSWNGEDYYLASPDCCDMFEALLDAETCEYVCAPSGGFTGQGDGQCPTFVDDAIHIETVWPLEE